MRQVQMAFRQNVTGCLLENFFLLDKCGSSTQFYVSIGSSRASLSMIRAAVENSKNPPSSDSLIQDRLKKEAVTEFWGNPKVVQDYEQYILKVQDSDIELQIDFKFQPNGQLTAYRIHSAELPYTHWHLMKRT